MGRKFRNCGGEKKARGDATLRAILNKNPSGGGGG
jgi:hypothetical protein